MQLIGIAKAAAEAPLLEAKRLVFYSQLRTGKWINRVAESRFGFDWSINPYRGCEMACTYCYARYTHEFMELSGDEDFETRIFAKTWNAAAFRAELARVPLSQGIALGTATDPYQHAERRYLLTQKILTELARRSGRKLWITTKSDLVVRDLDLLERVARRNMLSVNFTVTTLDRDLARGLEPAAPRPDLRLEALRQLSDRGIPCGVNCMPILPGLNDDEAGMTELARAAKSAGARWISGSVLFLKSPTREVFRRFLEREHPALTARYDAYYSQGSRAPREYQDEVRQRLEASRRAAGLSSKAPPYLPPDWESGRQLSLAL